MNTTSIDSDLAMSASPTAVRPSNRRVALCNGMFFSLLIALAAVPLIILRSSPWLESNWVLPLFSLAAAALCIVWWRSCDIGQAAVQRQFALAPSWWLVLGVLASLTLICFYIPQRQQFWGGYDDFQAYHPSFARLWSAAFDTINGRPALGWSYVFGRALGGGAIEGYLWYAAIQCCVNAFLLWAIMQTMLPNARALGLAVAIMYLVNRADPLKFYPLWAASPYGLAVGCLLFATWMFLLSSRQQHRGLLLLACASLGASLLMYEVGYLLAVIPLLLLWLDRRQNTLWVFWAFSWIATWLLFATRVAIFQLTSASSYQLSQASAAKISPQSLAENFAKHLRPIGKYVELPSEVGSYWWVATAVFVLAATSVWFIGRDDRRPSLRAWTTILMLAGIGIVLGIAPYSHMSYNARTQFFAAPSQALFFTVAICLPFYYLPRRVALAALSILVGLFSANATVLSFQTQFRQHPVNYDKIVHVCQQIRATSSSLSDETLIILMHDGPSPLGTNYSSYIGGEFWTGAKIVQIGDLADAHIQTEFASGGVSLTHFGTPLRFPYEKVIIYRLDADGTIHLQREWPEDEHTGTDVAGYDPLALLRPGPIRPRRDFDFPSWSGPPRDVIPHNTGIVFGRGWSSLQFDEGWLFRETLQDAELLINGQGQASVELALELGSVPNAGTGETFEILNERDSVLAAGQLLEKKKVHFRIPCDPQRLEVLRLRVNSLPSAKSAQPAAMRVYCSEGPLEHNPLPEVVDVTSGGVRLGDGWYLCELHEGRRLRWLNTAGEIITGSCDRGKSPALIIDASVGPGMDGQPCTIRLLDLEGQPLASATVNGRESVAFRLPVDLPQGTRLQLEVEGGGKPTPGDPRILNLMVTRCEWQSTATPDEVPSGTSESPRDPQ